MTRIVFIFAAATSSFCLASNAFAQSTNENPSGMDLGMLHAFVRLPVPTQVTTYYPPEPVASVAPLRVVKKRHKRRA